MIEVGRRARVRFLVSVPGAIIRREPSAFAGRVGTVEATYPETGTVLVKLDGFAVPLAFGECEIEDRLLAVVPTARVGGHFPGDPVERRKIEVIR